MMAENSESTMSIFDPQNKDVTWSLRIQRQRRKTSCCFSWIFPSPKGEIDKVLTNNVATWPRGSGSELPWESFFENLQNSQRATLGKESFQTFEIWKMHQMRAWMNSMHHLAPVSIEHFEKHPAAWSRRCRIERTYFLILWWSSVSSLLKVLNVIVFSFSPPIPRSPNRIQEISVSDKMSVHPGEARWCKFLDFGGWKVGQSGSGHFFVESSWEATEMAWMQTWICRWPSFIAVNGQSGGCQYGIAQRSGCLSITSTGETTNLSQCLGFHKSWTLQHCLICFSQKF